MVGLIDEAAELLDVQGTFDDEILAEEDKEDGYHSAPHQMAAIRLRDAAIVAELQVVVASHLTRQENAILRLRQRPALIPSTRMHHGWGKKCTTPSLSTQPYASWRHSPFKMVSM